MKTLTKRDARRVLEVVDAGLVSGLGKPKPGQMCVEAAICYALGEPHGDKPKCVAPCIRAYKVRLNDSLWSSDEARAKGMRRAAIAQLGSTKIDQLAWTKFVIEQGIKRILPIAIRAVADLKRVSNNDREALLVAADLCEREGSVESARSARKILRAYDAAYAYAAYAAAAYAYAAYAYAAYAAAYADADAAYAYAAYAAAYADADAASPASATPAEKRDEILTLAAEICVEACIKFGTQGSKWLDLTKGSSPSNFFTRRGYEI